MQLILSLFESVNLRNITVQALIELGDAGADTVIQVMLQRPSWGAVETLGALRKPAATEALLKALAFADEFLQGQIIAALGKIADPRAVEFLKEFACHRDLNTRLIAIESLGNIGDAAIDTLLSLASKSRTHEPILETSIELALERIGVNSTAKLVQALNQDNPRLRRVAVNVLSRTGPTPEAIEALGRCLYDRDPSIVIYAIKALAKLGKHAVPTFMQYIEKEPESDFHFYSIITNGLGKLGDSGANR